MFSNQDMINAVGGLPTSVGSTDMQSSIPGSDPTSMNPSYLSAFGQLAGSNPMFSQQPFQASHPQMGMSGQHHAIGGGGWNSYTHGGPHDIIQALMQMGGGGMG